MEHIKGLFSNSFRSNVHGLLSRCIPGGICPSPDRIDRMIAGDPPVYLYCGHGSDVCDNEGRLELLEVPEDCIYVNQATCGIPTKTDKNPILSMFRDPKNKLILDPVRNKETLEKQLGSMMYGSDTTLPFQVYSGTQRYVKNKFDPFAIQREEDQFRIYSVSGLIERKKFAKLPPSTLKYSELKTSISLEELKKCFTASVYPTVDELDIHFRSRYTPTQLNTLRFNDLLHERIVFWLDSDRLMQRFPGVHYNLLCRTLNGCEPRIAVLRRMNSSSNERGRTPGDILFQLNRFSSLPELLETALEFENRGIAIAPRRLEDILHDTYFNHHDILNKEEKINFISHVLHSSRPSTWDPPSELVPIAFKNLMFLFCAEKGFINVIRFLIANRIDVNYSNDAENVKNLEASGTTALLMAAKNGHTEIVNLLLQAGADKDHQNSRGDTAIKIAVRYQHADIVRSLLLVGVDVTIKNKKGISALSYGASEAEAEAEAATANLEPNTPRKVIKKLLKNYVAISRRSITHKNRNKRKRRTLRI